RRHRRFKDGSSIIPIKRPEQPWLPCSTSPTFATKSATHTRAPRLEADVAVRIAPSVWPHGWEEADGIRISGARSRTDTPNEALPQTDEACFVCGSDRQFMTSSGRTRLR